MKTPSAAIYPASAAASLVLTIIIAYVIAVSRNDVDPFWPYISDCVALFPESSVFGQLIDISVTIVAWTLFLRFKRLLGIASELTQNSADASFGSNVFRKVIVIASGATFVCSIVAMFGMIMVGNFQENRPGHYEAGVMAFAGGCCYLTGDTVLSWVLRRRCLLASINISSSITRAVIIIRTIVTCLAWAAGAAFVVGRQVALNTWIGAFPNQTSEEQFRGQLHWNRTLPGYSVHIMSTSCEWVTGAMFIVYLCTFVYEFRKFSAKVNLKSMSMTPLHVDETQDLTSSSS